jgi:hypothetical protein
MWLGVVVALTGLAWPSYLSSSPSWMNWRPCSAGAASLPDDRVAPFPPGGVEVFSPPLSPRAEIDLHSGGFGI